MLTHAWVILQEMPLNYAAARLFLTRSGPFIGCTAKQPRAVLAAQARDQPSVSRPPQFFFAGVCGGKGEDHRAIFPPRNWTV